MKESRRGQAADECPTEHRVCGFDCDECPQRIEKVRAHRVIAAQPLECVHEPREPRPAPPVARAVEQGVGALAAVDELEFHCGKRARQHRRQRDAVVAEGVDLGVPREAAREPARDIPAEVDRHRCPGDACVRELRPRALRAGSRDPARRGGDARELGGSGIAERARLRIGEQAEQAIVISDERDRVVDFARCVSRKDGRLARRRGLVEAERDPAQIVDGDDVEWSPRHRAVPGYEGVRRC